MLRPIEIEALAHKAIEDAISGAMSEDSQVEIKSQLPDDARKAARQIAALCNAAPGEDALWVVGFDEKKRTFTSPTGEIANWWPQVVSYFDGTPPTFNDRNVTINGLLRLTQDKTSSPQYGRIPAAKRIPN
jgi:hypothetical protein